MVLDYFGGDTQGGRNAYKRFVYKGIAEGPSPLLDIGIIGSDEFVNRIKEVYLAKIERTSPREQPHLKKIRSAFTPEKLIEAFCAITASEREVLWRRGKNSEERSMLMELLYRFCHIEQPEIGRLLGNIDYSAVSVSWKRLRLKMLEDPALKQKFDKILDDMSRIKI